MDFHTQITLRTKKLGLLIRDARMTERRTVKECAEAMGVTSALFHAYEEGRRAPSLPELETLVYYLKLPISHFWGKEVLSDLPSPVESLDLKRLIALRQRMIGALLRQERNNSNVSLKHISEQTGISVPRLKSYELGERPVPLPELESILGVMESRIETLFDQSGPIGQWMVNQRAMQKFLSCPRRFAYPPATN
jgi:transcriptional regulator with XRE-family HTH domain